MRRDRTPGDGAPDTQLTDREVELILAGSRTGSDDLVKLERFVAEISRTKPPHDTEHMATALAARARSTQRVRGVRRMATIAASAALLFALSGVAIAADGAVPGDALYGIDRALEAVGIGDGGMNERLEEVDALIDRGSEEDALEFLDEVIGDSPPSEASRAEAHRKTVSEHESTEPVTGVESSIVEERGRSSSENAETSPEQAGSPTDPNPQGKAVGQSDDTEPPGQEQANDNPEQPDNAGPKDDRAGPKEDNEPKATEKNSQRSDQESPRPDHVDPKNDEEPPGQTRSD